MDDLKPQKKNRFEKGSQEAKDFMATLRAKKKEINHQHHQLHQLLLLHLRRLHLLVLSLIH